MTIDPSTELQLGFDYQGLWLYYPPLLRLWPVSCYKRAGQHLGIRRGENSDRLNNENNSRSAEAT